MVLFALWCTHTLGINVYTRAGKSEITGTNILIHYWKGKTRDTTQVVVAFLIKCVHSNRARVTLRAHGKLFILLRMWPLCGQRSILTWTGRCSSAGTVPIFRTGWLALYLTEERYFTSSIDKKEPLESTILLWNDQGAIFPWSYTSFPLVWIHGSVIIKHRDYLIFYLN
jgi:hypothetical protein